MSCIQDDGEQVYLYHQRPTLHMTLYKNVFPHLLQICQGNNDIQLAILCSLLQSSACKEFFIVPEFCQKMIFDELDLDNLPLPPSFNFDEYSYKVVVCTCMLHIELHVLVNIYALNQLLVYTYCLIKVQIVYKSLDCLFFVYKFQNQLQSLVLIYKYKYCSLRKHYINKCFNATESFLPVLQKIPGSTLSKVSLIIVSYQMFC